MARLSRELCDRGVFHVMARSIPGIRVFERDCDKRLFLGELARSIRKHLAELYAFCVMTNHFHLLLLTESARVGDLIQPALSRVAQRWNWDHRRKGPIFDDRAKTIPVTTDRYFLNAARYIEFNPVKAGLVARPEHYAWSSARSYLSGEWDGLTSTQRLLDRLSSMGSPLDYANWLASPELPAWPYPEEPEWEPSPSEGPPESPEGLLTLAEANSARHGVLLEAVLGPSKQRSLVAARRDFILAAATAGYPGAAIARLLGRSRAAICKELSTRKS